jgi:hypothetical protein
MASADLSRRVGKVVGYPPLSDLGDPQHREFHEALLEAATFEDLPGKWQAAILKAERNLPKCRRLRQEIGFGACRSTMTARRVALMRRLSRSPTASRVSARFA